MFWKRLSISVLSALAVVAIASRINRPAERTTPAHEPLLAQTIATVSINMRTPHDAISSIRDAAGIPIHFDLRGIDPSGGKPAAEAAPPIILHDVRVADALAIVLDYFGYLERADVHEENRTVCIRLREDLVTPLRRVGRVYDVGDLEPYSVAMLVDELSDDTNQLEEPLVWGRFIWVRRTPRGHRTIEDLLDLLHREISIQARN